VESELATVRVERDRSRAALRDAEMELQSSGVVEPVALLHRSALCPSLLLTRAIFPLLARRFTRDL